MMSSNGARPSVHHLAVNGAGKMPIQPTPGAIRKTSQPKPKQRKSRTGCMTCKQKRLKCDEAKPACVQCTKKGIACEGYAKNFKWKSFEDIQEQKKNAPVRRRSSITTKRSEDDDMVDGPAAEGVEISRFQFTRSPSQLMPPPRGPISFVSPLLNNFSFSPSNNDFGSPNGTSGFNFSSPFTFLSSPKSEKAQSPMSISSLLCDPNDPNVISPPQHDGMHIKKETSFVATEFLVTRTPPPIQGIRPFWPEIEYHLSDESDNEDDIEELPRTSFTDLQAPSPKRRRLNHETPSDVYTFGLHHDELYMWDFYDRVTCKILSCKNAQGENPWRDDLISRAQSQSVEALKHALFAMTSFHMKLHGVEDADRMADRGLFHTNLAFQSLIKRMKAGIEFDENDIAAMLVLSFSEVWDDPRLDGRTHVLAASKIFDGHLRRLHEKNKQASPFMRFLYNTWLYLDVLSSLSSGDDPCSLGFLNSTPTSSPATSPFSDRSSGGSFSLQNQIDSLLGCAGDLFPLIAQASRVSNHLRETVIHDSHLQYIADGIAVRQDLMDWQPPDINVLHASRDEHCALTDVLRTAEVYRQTALLHLYRAFSPFGKDIPKLADDILDLLLLIPKESGSLCIHIWPLMAAGCEQSDEKKRQLVRNRFEEVRQKLKVANVEQAIELLQEVWNKKDQGEQNVGWVSIAKERGWHLLLG